MRKQPLVSIIVPVYNTEKYLKKCLNSITQQTYFNLEIIVINDGSTDESGRIADGLSVDDGRIKVFHKENGGVSSARNAGIKYAKGEYITFVDADDLIHETHISNLIKSLNETRADIVSTRMVFSSVSDDEFLRKKISNKKTNKVYTSNAALFALYNGTLEKGGNGCQLFKTRLIKDNELYYNTSMSIGEDFDFFARAIIISSKVLVDYRDTYFYRRNDDSAVHRPFSIEHYNAIYNVQDAGRNVENQIPGIKRVLDNNLLANSISYGALMYDVRQKYPNEFKQIKMNIKKYKYSTLFSNDIKFNTRIKVLIVIIFGVRLGFRIVRNLIRL